MDRPRYRTDVGEFVGLAVAGGGGEVLGQAEVEQLYQPAAGEENIGRRDVAVDDALGMSGAQRVGDLARDVDDLVDRHRATQQSGLQAGTFEQFHGDEGLRPLVADFQDGADVGVVQRRGQPGFALEPPDRIDVLGQVFLDDLDRHGTGKASILRLIDHTHPARAERPDEVEVGQLASDHMALSRVPASRKAETGARTAPDPLDRAAADSLSDSTLHILERAQAGDEQAATILVERALPPVRRWARGRLPRYARSDADTEDVIQDVFLRTLRGIKRFQHRTVGGLQAYLRRRSSTGSATSFADRSVAGPAPDWNRSRGTGSRLPWRRRSCASNWTGSSRPFARCDPQTGRSSSGASSLATRSTRSP